MIMIRRRSRREGGSSAHFAPGDLVRHRRYGSRAVVVDLDSECKAAEGWYASNQTQPPRDQPWYHLLVHRAAHTTYAAESNLEADGTGEEISHPLLPLFFEPFADGAYERNDRAWPTS